MLKKKNAVQYYTKCVIFLYTYFSKSYWKIRGFRADENFQVKNFSFFWDYAVFSG